jgi:REP element-mobilizing transposase RayT
MNKFRNTYRIDSPRLKAWDYSRAGGYFVTICVKDRDCCLGGINNNEVSLSPFGGIVSRCWEEIPSHFSSVSLDEFVVMPNHVHGIIVINGRDGACPVSTKKQPSLSVIVGAFKSAVTRKIHSEMPASAFIWQERFFDHVIRNDVDLDRVREYIHNNPLQWALDEENPDVATKPS